MSRRVAPLRGGNDRLRLLVNGRPAHVEQHRVAYDIVLPAANPLLAVMLADEA